MKSFSLLLFFSIFSLTIFAGKSWRIGKRNYNIVSDTIDKSISKGKFKIKGVVKMFSSNNPIEGVLVGNTTSGSWIRTDSEGLFNLEMSTIDSSIYFYLEGWGEVVIEDYIFQEQHIITLNVWLDQNVNNNGVKRKPVIYLYSDEPLTASIKIDPLGKFTFTYPPYNEGWEVDISPKGTITDNSSGNAFPYLFWEANTEYLFYDFYQGEMNGFVIKTDTSISFLENQLSDLGFNETEMTDFITYWGPILEKKEYALIQFIIDDDYNSSIAEITINPAPDAMRRVFILCSELNSPVDGMEVNPQIFNSFDRKGFTVVEWGGSIINLNLIKQ